MDAEKVRALQIIAEMLKGELGEYHKAQNGVLMMRHNQDKAECGIGGCKYTPEEWRDAYRHLDRTGDKVLSALDDCIYWNVGAGKDIK